MRPPSIWANELVVTRYKALADLSCSATIIAGCLRAEFGIPVTRSAVIGRANRDGIILRGDVAKFGFKPERVSRKGLRRSAPRKGPLKKLPVTKAVRFEPATEIVKSPRLKTLLELEDNHCRWPIDDPKGNVAGFCGNDRHDEFSYCIGHCRIAYSKIRNDRPRAHVLPSKSVMWGGWA